MEAGLIWGLSSFGVAGREKSKFWLGDIHLSKSLVLTIIDEARVPTQNPKL